MLNKINLFYEKWDSIRLMHSFPPYGVIAWIASCCSCYKRLVMLFFLDVLIG